MFVFDWSYYPCIIVHSSTDHTYHLTTFLIPSILTDSDPYRFLTPLQLTLSTYTHQTTTTPCLQLGHTITHPSLHHDIFINIATQNVGGLKSESERGSGPKISTLRVLAREKLDFFVLTETRVDARAVKKIKLKQNLHVTMHSLHPRPRGGGHGFL
jgi:hypothetical protein